MLESLFNNVAFFLQHRCFPVSFVKFLKTSRSLYLSEILSDDRVLWTSKITLFSFRTLLSDSRVHGYFVIVFILKFLVSVTVARITTLASTILIELIKLRIISRIIASSPCNLL